MAKDSSVPQPGPARLAKGAGPDEWLEQAKQCKYLPEADMKRLCEIVKECLMEGECLPSKNQRASHVEHGMLLAAPCVLDHCELNFKYDTKSYLLTFGHQNPTYNLSERLSQYVATFTASSMTYSSSSVSPEECPAMPPLHLCPHLSQYQAPSIH